MKSQPSLTNESRIDLIDGFRCIAALWVVVYHYYWRFASIETGPEYPLWPFIRYGYFGVQLFFMISGFVIYHSLEKTYSFKEFIGKRYLRLAPTLLLCSIFTYIVVVYWNDSSRIGVYEIHNPLVFLFSFTFVSPFAWNSLLGRTDIGFVDMAYWSLVPEVIFYITASLVYFNSRKENFVRNWLLLVFILWMSRVCTSPKLEGITPDFLLSFARGYYQGLFDLHVHEWAYFSVGVLCYELWMRRPISKLVWALAASVFFLEAYFIGVPAVRIFFISGIALWAVFLYRPQWLGFLRWRPIQMIGLSSYPLYLLHQSAGLVLMEKLVVWTNHSVPGWLLLIVVLIVFVLLAYFVFVYFEKPVTSSLKSKLLRKNNLKGVHAA